jgi:hypothetical protein
MMMLIMGIMRAILSGSIEFDAFFSCLRVSVLAGDVPSVL